MAFLMLAAASGRAEGDAAPTRAQIEQHLNAMYPVPSGNYIQKWVRPIRYQVSDLTGTIDKGMFQRKAAEFRQRFAIDIRERTLPDGTDTNVLFLFTDNVRSAARRPEVRAVFQGSRMTDEQYEKFIERATLETAFRITDTDSSRSIVRSVTMFDLNRLPMARWESLVVGFIYAVLAPTATSDVIRPSRANTQNLGKIDGLPPIDVVFLHALYGPSIEPGMPFHLARPIMVNSMVRYLGSR